MDNETTQQIVALQDQIKTLNGDMQSLREALKGKQDRLVLKKNGISSEELDAIAEETRKRARLDSALADKIATNRSP
ncbi:hypothetical protein [Vreelandella aquamarina]|uniref:hypothetical protein n=1 Tax=Vreelandella aquamarina TaxID=77097 RepID=UPI001D18FFDD|nr:hypothetical protein [Halomonas meridiana]MCC4288584.1 hypothetical protein [Halomonas meridiana]